MNAEVWEMPKLWVTVQPSSIDLGHSSANQLSAGPAPLTLPTSFTCSAHLCTQLPLLTGNQTSIYSPVPHSISLSDCSLWDFPACVCQKFSKQFSKYLNGVPTCWIFSSVHAPFITVRKRHISNTTATLSHGMLSVTSCGALGST